MGRTIDAAAWRHYERGKLMRGAEAVASMIRMQRKVRPRGHPSVQRSIRIPRELVPVLETAGHSLADGAERLWDIAHDAASEVGDEWHEVVAVAQREKITEGAALGRLAKAAIAAAKKGRR